MKDGSAIYVSIPVNNIAILVMEIYKEYKVPFWSLLLDLKIIMLTFSTILRRRV